MQVLYLVGVLLMNFDLLTGVHSQLCPSTTGIYYLHINKNRYTPFHLLCTQYSVSPSWFFISQYIKYNHRLTTLEFQRTKPTTHYCTLHLNSIEQLTFFASENGHKTCYVVPRRHHPLFSHAQREPGFSLTTS